LVHGAALRLDKWLWFARLTKSRSAARSLCESRRLRIDGRVVERASALVRAGQVLSFPDAEDRADGSVVIVRVEGLADRRGPYAEARLMYTDLAADVAPETGDCAALAAQSAGGMRRHSAMGAHQGGQHASHFSH
jgi:ribosome-associated heat shock protein Hsp15